MRSDAAAARCRAAGLAVLLALAAACDGHGAPESAGRRLYRDGLLPSGAPVRAVVQGDVPVEGAQLPCAACHQRSGLGTSEGPTAVPPVTGPALFASTNGARPRPAYTDDTLARAVRDGVDPAGRRLDPLMPRYRLADADARALVGYLKALSAQPAPGVTDDTIRFATIVSDGVDPAARDAMLGVLDTFFAAKNGETRLEPARARAAPTRDGSRAYRRWVLDRWTLHGAPETWPAQLADAYRREPVFAVVSGLVAGPWRPVHDFCERNEIPCILPNTDAPAIADGDFYTLYFSKGVVIEAEAIAEHAAHGASAAPLLQVFHADGVGDTAAGALRAAGTRGHGAIVDLRLEPGERLDAHDLGRRVAETRAAAVVLWLPANELASLDAGLAGARRLYLSSTLLHEQVGAVPATLRDRAFVAQPYSPPAERAVTVRRLRAWLASRGRDVTDERVEAQTYFACLTVGEAVTHVRWLLYRDYLLDTVDHAAGGLAELWSYYPRLSFGPRQRYLAKGCYILALGGQGPATSVTAAAWLPLGS